MLLELYRETLSRATPTTTEKKANFTIISTDSEISDRYKTQHIIQNKLSKLIVRGDVFKLTKSSQKTLRLTRSWKNGFVGKSTSLATRVGTLAPTCKASQVNTSVSPALLLSQRGGGDSRTDQKVVGQLAQCTLHHINKSNLVSTPESGPLISTCTP